MILRALLLSMTALLSTTGAAAEDAARLEALLHSNCHDDNMTDRCDPDVQREVRAMFDLRSIEQLNTENIQVRRVFFVDGHGNDLPVVSFERAPGEPPRVRVAAIVAANGARRVVNLMAPVPLNTWDDILEASRFFHRELGEEPTPAETPLPPGAQRVPAICLHSWVITGEASDPGAEMPVRRATQDVCNDGLVWPFAERAAALALDSIPSCSGIDVERSRSPITALSLCALLEGDAVSAGEALNQAMMLRGASSTLAMFIHDRAEINWQGESVSGFQTLQAWPRLVGRNFLDYKRVIGRDLDRVTIIGQIAEYERDTPSTPRQRIARFEQTWVRENGFDFRLRTMRVQPWSDWSQLQ